MSGKRGIFLTIDVAVSLLLMFTLISVAAYYFTQPSSEAFSSHLIRNYLRDAASIMAREGHFAAPLESANDSDTSGMRAVMRSLPESVCMQAEAYGTAVPSSLTGYWKLDENNGATVADYSGSQLTGAIIGSPQAVESGKSYRALSFNGSGSMVNVSDAFGLNPHNESFSISAWVNASPNQQATARIFAKLPSGGYPGYSLHLRSSDGKAVACYFSASSTCNGGGTEVATDSNVSGAGWKHIVAVFDRHAGNVTLYVDAVKQAAIDTAFAPAAQINSTAGATIGADYASGAVGNVFTGQIDDVRLYKKALTQSEINALYSNSRNLLYVVTRGNCTAGAEGVQALEVPFAYSIGQDQSGYGMAVLRAWQRGAG